jgi:Tfp pilus assembly protein FimV
VEPSTPREARPAQRRSRAGRRQLRRRRLAGLLRFGVFLLLIFIAVWAGVRVAHAGTDASVYTGHPYVVRGGDTLWAIAAREYGAEADLRRAVYEIREANDLSGAGLRPGARLTLPYLGE